MFSYPNVCRNVFLFQYFLDFISAVYIMPTEDCKILKFSFKQSVKKKKEKKYIEPVNCSVTRLHCLLNIFFCVCVRVRVCVYTYVYMHTLPCVCIYMCDCDLCNTNYGIGQLLSIHPIILFSGIVASIYTAAFLLRLIGCCCFLCTKEKCQTSAACSGNGCSH